MGRNPAIAVVSGVRADLVVRAVISLCAPGFGCRFPLEAMPNASRKVFSIAKFGRGMHEVWHSQIVTCIIVVFI